MPTTDVLDATELAALGAVIGPASATDGAIARFDTTTGKLLKNSTTADIKTLLSITNVEDKSSATIRGELTSGNVTTALAFTPENAANRAIANGYAPLDATAKVATTYLPDAVLGAVSYQGAWNASTNDPVIPAAATSNKGHYYVVTTAGSTALDGITDWLLGDWAISNGTIWQKVDNTDAVISVAGLTGTISDASLRTALGLVIGTDVQAYDADLTTWAGLTPSANAQSLVTAADYAAMKTLLGLTVGTNVQAYDAELAALAGLTSAADKVPYFTGSGTAAVADFTAAGRALMDDANAAAQLVTLGAAKGDGNYPTESMIIAVGDETTSITTGTAKVTFRIPYAFTLTSVRASLTTASSSGIPTVDINEGGVSILSTKLTIDASEKTSTTAATAAVISDTSLADDAEITIDIDVAGTGAAGLKVYLIGRRT